MKNRVTNYITKVNNNQIKGVTDRKSFAETITLCEKTMAELKAIYWFEKELLVAVSILISNATAPESLEMLTMHENYLQEHIKKLEKNFPFIGTVPLPKKKVA